MTPPSGFRTRWSGAIPAPVQPLLPDDQAADDAVVRLTAAVAALGCALDTPRLDPRPHALSTAASLPATAQTALTAFARDWLVYLAMHPPASASADAVQMATTLLADTSCFAPPVGARRAD